jgi:hypothetical protein
MVIKKPIYPDRVRRIIGSFSWLDHRLISDGYLHVMTRNEIPLYFFLALVGDKQGLSFYSEASICELLKMNPFEFHKARELLIDRSLLACKNGLFQLLQLPNPSDRERSNNQGNFRSIKEIMQML